MKDEEMAEEYANKHTHYEVAKGLSGEAYAKKVSDVTIQQAFLAGLKAGRLQWHKVENELPISDKDKYYFVVDKLNNRMIARFYEGKWSNYSVIDDVVAWCELPTFDKE